MIQHILFVNACMRGREESRTWLLSQAFLEACKERWPKAEILERDLAVCDLPVLTGPMTTEGTRASRPTPGIPCLPPPMRCRALIWWWAMWSPACKTGYIVPAERTGGLAE